MEAENTRLKADYEAEKERADRSAQGIQEASSTVQDLREQVKSLQEQLKAPRTPLEKVKAKFKVPEGEEAFLQVVETTVGGEELAEPRVRSYDPTQYDNMISKQAGYKAEVLRDPRKS